MYINNPKNRFLTASAVSQIFLPKRETLAERRGASENEKFEMPPGQIPDSSGCLRIDFKQ